MIKRIRRWLAGWKQAVTELKQMGGLNFGRPKRNPTERQEDEKKTLSRKG